MPKFLNGFRSVSEPIHPMPRDGEGTNDLRYAFQEAYAGAAPDAIFQEFRFAPSRSVRCSVKEWSHWPKPRTFKTRGGVIIVEPSGNEECELSPVAVTIDFYVPGSSYAFCESFSVASVDAAWKLARHYLAFCAASGRAAAAK